MTGPDYSTWLTKQQAADALGVSTKTVEQFAKDRKLEQAVWRRPTGGPPVRVYFPDDVARVASERHQAPQVFVLPAVQDPPSNGNGNHAAIARVSTASDVPTGEDVLRLVFAAALRTLASENPPTSENSEKLFVSISQAAAISGLSWTYLKRQLEAGTLKGIKDGRSWRIRRKDLEGL